MEMDVNLHKSRGVAVELMTISSGSYNLNNTNNNNNNHNNNNNNNHINNGHSTFGAAHIITSSSSAASAPASAPAFSSSAFPSAHSPMRAAAPLATTTPTHRVGCCGILGRLLCASAANTAKTASSSGDYNNISSILPHSPPPAHLLQARNDAASALGCGIVRRTQHRRTPQEIYFESRGKSCKKLLKFNGSSNKILLYPEEGWARTASSSYWTITPCWWQPNRCRIEEFAGTQRQTTKAKMVPLEQKGSLLIAGHFRSKKSGGGGNGGYKGAAGGTDKEADEFKLYLSSNISMEDYNMGYCLTGFVERRCQQTNTFQMTHFAVIKRQWPSISSDAKST